MKRTMCLLVALLLAVSVTQSQEIAGKPENLTMTLAWIADAGEPKQYVFVINGVTAYKTLDGLKNYLKGLSRNSTITWAPGCCRIGEEPLLNSEEEMKAFKEFCESTGIKFTLVPSG